MKQRLVDPSLPTVAFNPPGSFLGPDPGPRDGPKEVVQRTTGPVLWPTGVSFPAPVTETPSLAQWMVRQGLPAALPSVLTESSAPHPPPELLKV